MRRKRMECMLAKPYLANKDAYARMKAIAIQPKYNGIRCLATVINPTICLRSSTWMEIQGFYKIKSELVGLPDGTYDGELYKHGMPLQEISGIARSRREVMEKDSLDFHCFDLVSADDQITRSSKIENLFHRFERCKIVPTTFYRELPTEEWLIKERDSWKALGYEGIIIRDAYGCYEFKKSNFLLKWKTVNRKWFRIIAINEERDQYGEPKGSLGSIALSSENGIFKAGTGLTAIDREHYWTTWIIGWWALIEFPELTKRGVPHQPSILEIAEERREEE